MTIQDQTGAAWSVLSGVPVLASENPAPKFGARCLTAASGVGNLILSRDGARVNEAPTDVAGYSAVLDVWQYAKTGAIAHTTEMGNKTLSAFTMLEIDTFVGIWITANYVKTDQPKIRAVVPWLAEYGDTWLNVRAALDDAGVTLFIDGVLVAHVAIPGAVSTIFPINHAVQTITTKMFVDDFKAMLTPGLSDAGYTPRSAPWPNPG